MLDLLKRYLNNILTKLYYGDKQQSFRGSFRNIQIVPIGNGFSKTKIPIKPMACI